MHKKKLLIAALAIAIGIAGYAIFKPGSSGSLKGGKGGGEPVVSVRFVTVETRSVPVVFETSGFVTPVSTVEVRSQLSSTIREILVREGDSVAAGTPLFRLDARAEAASLEKLKAQRARNEALLGEAQRTLDRNIELQSRGFVSQGIVDASKSNVAALIASVAADRAAIAEAQVTIDRGVIAAPQSGRVGLINVRVGSLVQPGNTQALTTLTQLDPIDVAFSLPESRLAQLRAAQARGEVMVTVIDASGTHQGKLNFIDSTVDAAAGGVRVKARFGNDKYPLWPGSQVAVSLTLDTISDAATAPLTAVQVGPEGQFVYLADEQGRAKAVPVKIRYQDARFAVLEGVSAGARVVNVGGQNLRPGVKLRDADQAPKAGEGKQ